MWVLRIRFKNKAGELTELKYEREKGEDAVDMLLNEEVKETIITHFRSYPSPVLIEVFTTGEYNFEKTIWYRSTIKGSSTFGQIVAMIYDTLFFETGY